MVLHAVIMYQTAVSKYIGVINEFTPGVAHLYGDGLKLSGKQETANFQCNFTCMAELAMYYQPLVSNNLTEHM